jgi:hypothetical protein
MNNEQEQAIGLLQKHNRISPVLFQQKMGITQEKAQDLCEFAWNWQAKNCFLLRHLGITIEEYEGICNG